MSLLALSVAFIAGGISITSPCCLPLLPGYLGYLSGMSMEDARHRRMRTLVAALLFVAGFSIVFMVLGATASELGSLLFAHKARVYQVAGVFILLMGLALLLEGRIGWLARGGDWSRRWAHGQLWAALPLGASFALTWTPCIGPVLGAILTLAGTTADLGAGVTLLAAYSLGLAVPFVLLSLAVPSFRRWTSHLGHAMAVVQYVSGGLLVAMGLMLLTNRWLPLISPVLSWYARAHWPPI